MNFFYATFRMQVHLMKNKTSIAGMKRVLLHLVLALILIHFSCEKDDDIDGQDFRFDATVVGKGLDCGETYLIDLQKRKGNSEIADGIYYGDGLPRN